MESTAVFRRDSRVGWSAWMALLAFLAVVLAAVPERWGVTPVYREALQNWIAGRDLYNESGHGFLYLPASVAAYLPLLIEPHLVGEILWRCFTVGTFAWGTWTFSRLAAGWIGRPVFAILSVVAAILALPGGRNGQTTLPMAGLLMIAAAEAAAGRDGRAGLAAVGALLLKPLAIPAVLVLAACRPRSIPVIVAGTLAVLAAPYIAADPGWVGRQYGGFANVLTLSERMSNEAWATLAGASSVFGVPLPAPLRAGLSLAAAGVTLGGAVLAWRSRPPAEAAATMYSLSMLWIMLFSPRTENNTYACIAPTLGLAIATAVYGVGPAGFGRSAPRAAAAVLLAVAVIGSYEVGRLLAPGVRAVWLAPLATVVLMLDTWWCLFRGGRRDGPPAG